MRNRNKQMYLAAISHMTVEQLGEELWCLLQLENYQSMAKEKLLRRVSKLQQQSDLRRNIADDDNKVIESLSAQLGVAQKSNADYHRENQALRLELTNAKRDLDTVAQEKERLQRDYNTRGDKILGLETAVKNLGADAGLIESLKEQVADLNRRYEEQQRKLVQAVSGEKMWQSEAQRERKKAEAAQASMQQEHATNQELVSEIDTMQNKLAESTKAIAELKQTLQTSRDAHDGTCLELYRRNAENAKLSKELGQRTHALECAISKLNELGVDGVDLPKDGVKFSNFVYSKPPSYGVPLQRQLDQLADEHRELQGQHRELQDKHEHLLERIQRVIAGRESAIAYSKKLAGELHNSKQCDEKLLTATRRIEHLSKALRVAQQHRDNAIRQRDDAVNSLSHMCKQRDEARNELARRKILEEVNKKHFGEAADYSVLEERIVEHLVKTACEVKKPKPKRTVTVEFYRATR